MRSNACKQPEFTYGRFSLLRFQDGDASTQFRNEPVGEVVWSEYPRHRPVVDSFKR